MQKLLKRLNKRLILEYFNEYERDFVFTVYIKILSILTLLTVIPCIFWVKNIPLSICIFLICTGVSNYTTNSLIFREYNKKRTDRVWFRNYKSITSSYKVSWLYNKYITKAEFDGFSIYEKIEKAELELLAFEVNELRLQSLAYKELTYSLDLLESLDNMEDEERTRQLAKIVHEDSSRFECITI